MIHIVGPCRRELRKIPRSVREDLADALTRLDEGLTLAMPLSKPMPSIGAGVHELRLKDRSGAYRVIYVVVMQEGIGVLHAFKKTTRTTPRTNIELARKRLQGLKA